MQIWLHKLLTLVCCIFDLVIINHTYDNTIVRTTYNASYFFLYTNSYFTMTKTNKISTYISMKQLSFSILWNQNEGCHLLPTIYSMLLWLCCISGTFVALRMMIVASIYLLLFYQFLVMVKELFLYKLYAFLTTWNL